MDELKNTRTLADMLDLAEQRGMEKGSGDSALALLAMDVAVGVREGSFVNVAQVKGKENDIHSMWKRYAKGQNAKAPAERSAKSISSHVSRLQAIADAASKMSNFAGDVMVKVLDTRELIINDKASKVKTWPLYDCYVNAARLQNDAKNVGILSDDLVVEAVVKVPKVKTLVEHLQAIQESIDALIDPKSTYQVDSHYKYLVVGASNDISKLVDAAKRAAMTPEEREEFDAAQNAIENVRFERAQAEKRATERALEVGDAISEEKLAA
jgi:hypothetical protein